MRRIIMLFSVPILLLLGVVTAGSALADTVNGGTLTAGTPVTGTVSVANRDISYAFVATTGVPVNFGITPAN